MNVCQPDIFVFCLRSYWLSVGMRICLARSLQKCTTKMRSEHKSTRVNELSLVYFKWVSARDSPTERKILVRNTQLTLKRCIAESIEWRALPRNSDKRYSHLQRNGNALIIVSQTQRAVDETPHFILSLAAISLHSGLQFTKWILSLLASECQNNENNNNRLGSFLCVPYLRYDYWLTAFCKTLFFISQWTCTARGRKKKHLCSGFWQRSIFHSTSLLYYMLYTWMSVQPGALFLLGLRSSSALFGWTFRGKMYRDVRTSDRNDATKRSKKCSAL